MSSESLAKKPESSRPLKTSITPNDLSRNTEWDSIAWILRIGCALCFFGWAWQHIRWDVPYREILWSPELFGWVVEGFGVSWESFVGSAENDATIQGFIRNMGFIYIIFGVLALTVRKKSWGQIAMLAFGSLNLLLVAYLQYRDKKLAVGQFVEYGSQVLIPLILILYITCGNTAWLRHIARFAIVCTFAGHGLYAIGYYEVPGNFVTMTMDILRCSEPFAMQVLEIAGVLDFAICVMIFQKAMLRPALLYAIFWGFATALARFWWGVGAAGMGPALEGYLHLTIYRTPHYIVPLFLLMATAAAESKPLKTFAFGPLFQRSKAPAET